MVDRDDVIRALGCLTGNCHRAVTQQECRESGCPYSGKDCEIAVMESALKLLKAKREPSVPAVPLDKLCEWLSRNAWAFDCEYCEGYCKAMTDCENDVGSNPEYWKDKLTNWMEEQDAVD